MLNGKNSQQVAALDTHTHTHTHKLRIITLVTHRLNSPKARCFLQDCNGICVQRQDQTLTIPASADPRAFVILPVENFSTDVTLKGDHWPWKQRFPESFSEKICIVNSSQPYLIISFCMEGTSIVQRLASERGNKMTREAGQSICRVVFDLRGFNCIFFWEFHARTGPTRCAISRRNSSPWPTNKSECTYCTRLMAVNTTHLGFEC